MFKSSVLTLILLSITLLASAQEASPRHAVGADFNGDGRPDIVAGGRATHNVKLYVNSR